MSKDIELEKKLKVIIAKSKESLADAKRLHQENHYNGAASRAYYAVFQSLQAILLTLGLSFSKHSGVIGTFNKEFIHKGVFPQDFSKKVKQLYEERQIGDYSFDKQVDPENSNQNIIAAETIIKSIEEYLIKENFIMV